MRGAMRAVAVLAIVAVQVGAPCAARAAATLRPDGTILGPVVRLSDLFDDAGEEARRALGPAPAPGARIIVEAPQLAAIARQFGVDWRPASAADRLVLTRPGRPLAREELLAPLRAELARAGIPEGAELEIPGLVPPTVVTDAPAQISVDQLDCDATSGRFTAQLSISAPGMDLVAMRVSGEAVQMVDLPVPARRLAAGDIVQAEDLRIGRVRAATLTQAVARAPAQAVGLEVRRPMAPGVPLALADLGPPALVQKGRIVAMTLDVAGLAVTAQGQAMENGGMGDEVRVLNQASGAVVQAEVTGPGQARVMPGSLPLRPATRGGSRGLRLAEP